MEAIRLSSSDVFGPNGTARHLLDHVAEKWTALIISSLSQGGKRPSELKLELGGISEKVLNQTLRKLQMDRIIERKVYSVVPPKVEYSLSIHGVALATVFLELQNWAEEHASAFNQIIPEELNQAEIGGSASRLVFERVAEKWTVKIVYLLSQGTRRYNQLKREVEGSSQKMLTQTLRNLERDGLVERKEYPVVPPKVEYSLTPLGLSLGQRFEALCNWADEHYAELKAGYLIEEKA